MEQDVFHLRTPADVMNNHVAPIRSFPIDDDPDVRNIAAEVPCHKVAGVVIRGARSARQCLSVALKEHHQIGNTPMINV